MKNRKPDDKIRVDPPEGAADNRLHRFFLANGQIRGVVLCGTRMINEMRAVHELGILETLVLGRAFLGAGLMSADLKGRDRFALGVDCSGPVRGLLVEANAFGDLRGYLKQVPIPIDRPMEDTDLSPFFGAGLLTVTRYLEDAKNPFTGQVILKYGNLAQDLAYYYQESEQIPTAFRLGIDFDGEGNVTGAGGLFLQAMPAADESIISEIEALVTALPSIGAAFRNPHPRQWIESHFHAFTPRFTETRRTEFFCPCNRKRLRKLLFLLPPDEIEDILKNGPFPLEIRCHYCNTPYEFSRKSIREMYRLRYPRN
jgi:molecular chaperone Hsp33